MLYYFFFHRMFCVKTKEATRVTSAAVVMWTAFWNPRIRPWHLLFFVVLVVTKANQIMFGNGVIWLTKCPRFSYTIVHSCTILCFNQICFTSKVDKSAYGQEADLYCSVLDWRAWLCTFCSNFHHHQIVILEKKSSTKIWNRNYFPRDLEGF